MEATGERRADDPVQSGMGKGKNGEGRGRAGRETDKEFESENSVRTRERDAGLHVALFLVLLSPGYNPPRRRWCLYLSRGKPPSVRVSLSLAFPPHPTFCHTLSPSTFCQPALTPCRLSTLLVPDTLSVLPPDSTHCHPPAFLRPSHSLRFTPRRFSLYPTAAASLTSAFIRRSDYSPHGHTPC